MTESDPSSATDIVPTDLAVQEATAQPGAWLNKRAAASALGVSEKTIERRVAQGQLRQQMTTGGRVEVWIDGATSDTSLDTRQETAQDASSVALAVLSEHRALLAMLDARDALVRDQAEELGRLRAELARLSEDVSDTRPWWRRLLGLDTKNRLRAGVEDG